MLDLKHPVTQKRARLYTGAMIAACVFFVYWCTLAPGLSFVDSGELAAVCATAGIAHPTGYPLYTMLGWAATRIPLGVRPIFALNLMSALFSCCALLLFFSFLCHVFSSPHHFSGAPGREASGLPALVSPACGTLLLGFSRVFWSVSLVNEVYALHGLFVCLIMLLSVKSFCCRSTGRPAGMKTAGALALILGVSFCNHMSTVLVLPALLFLMTSQRGTWRPTAKKLLVMGALFLLGLGLYLYLPLRAAGEPALNWGNPQTWKTFYWHVSAKQYRVWMFSSFDVACEQAEYFLQLVLQSFGYLPLLLVPFGVWYLFHVSRSLCWFSVLLFCTDVLYAINYDIRDIDAYFLPAILVCSLWMAGAVRFWVALLCERRSVLCRAGAASLGLVFLVPLGWNYAAVDQSRSRHVEQYTETILDSVAEGALILSYQWDYFCSPAYYLQEVEGKRRDVTVIEVNLLKRSWYLHQLRRNCPGLMNASRREVELFSRELDAFERGRPYDPQTIQRLYIAVINSFIEKSMPRRPVYLTCEQEREIGAGFQRVPEGLVFRLYPPGNGYRRFDGSLPGLPGSDDFRADDRYHTALRSFYAFMLVSRGLYELRFGGRDDAAVLIGRAGRIYPDYPLVQKALARLRGSP